jgi:hypothetical protein
VAEVDIVCFADDLAAVLEAEEAIRWAIKKTGDLEVQVVMSSKKDLAERYLARLRWKTYPGALPSLKFLDQANGADTNPRAWPQCEGFRPASLDTCVSWTLEGHGLHPEWASSQLTRCDPSGNNLFRALNLLQHTLDYQYSGRFKG